MGRLLFRLLLVVSAFTLPDCPAMAGMQAPFPTGAPDIWRLHESVVVRLDAISFFALVFVLSAVVIWLLWNYIRRDFPRLPRLTLAKSLAGVGLWGLLFVIVLAMISGARELMTPRAWEKQGFSYRLSNDEVRLAEERLRDERTQRLERLHLELLRFAARHEDHFPTTLDEAGISDDLRRPPNSGGLTYHYLSPFASAEGKKVLAYEPPLYGHEQLVLMADGTIAPMKSDEIHDLIFGKADP